MNRRLETIPKKEKATPYELQGIMNDLAEIDSKLQNIDQSDSAIELLHINILDCYRLAQTAKERLITSN